MTETEEIKKQIKEEGRTLKWLWRKVRVKGFATLAYTRFIEIMNGSYLGGYAPDVVQTAKQIMKDEQQKSA